MDFSDMTFIIANIYAAAWLHLFATDKQVIGYLAIIFLVLAALASHYESKRKEENE